MLPVMDEPAWSGQDYLWDPYRLTAVGDNTQACVAAADPDSLVAPVLPGPALPSTAACRSSRAMCKVEGCQRLLAEEKPYYQRFSVCEEHMRCLSLDINGQLSRLCQQCGKFEPLEAFDDNKRSCRARLQEHNKRRRKMGVSSRSLRKHRRHAAAVTKANKAAKAAAAAMEEGLEGLEQQQAAAAGAGPDSGAGPDAAVDASGVAVPGSSASGEAQGAAAAAAAAAAGTPASSSPLPLTAGLTAGSSTAAVGPTAASRSNSSAPAVDAAAAPLAGTAEAASTGCSQLAATPQPPTQQQQQLGRQESVVLVEAAAPLVAGDQEMVADHDMVAGQDMDGEAGALLPATAGSWSAEPAGGWGLLPAVQTQAQPLLSPKPEPQQQLGAQQPLPWLVAELLQPSSPSISDMLLPDLHMADAPEPPAAAAAAAAEPTLPPPVPYESSLLYRPGVATQPLPRPATAGTGSSSGTRPSGPDPGARSSSQQQRAADRLNKHGSSCSSSSVAVVGTAAQPQQGSRPAAGVASSALDTPPAGAGKVGKVLPASTFSEEDRRLLDELLAESAEIVGAALQPDACAAAAAPAATGRGKRYRGLAGGCADGVQQQQQPGVCAGLPLPSDACADHAMPLPNIELPPIFNRDDSAEDNRMFGSGSSTDSGGSGKRQKPWPSSSRGGSRHAAQGVQAMQLLQQHSQYQQLQALQVQLQQSMLAAPYGRHQQQQQQQDLMGGLAAAGHPSMYGQQLQGLLQHAGMAAAAQQQSAAPCAFPASQDCLGLAPQANAYAAVQLPLQQQHAMAQFVSGHEGVPGSSTAEFFNSIGGVAPSSMQWPAPQLSAVLQQPQQAETQELSAVLAVAWGGGEAATYQPVDSSLRMSVKIHGVEPNQLQPELLPRVNSLLGSGSGTQPGASPGMQVECGYMRPGCVHLVLQLRSPADLQAAAEALVAAGRGLDASSWGWVLLNSNPSSRAGAAGENQQQPPPPVSITVQLGNQSVLLVRNGGPDADGEAFLQGLLQQQGLLRDVSTAEQDQQHARVPQLHAIMPCCVSSRSIAASGRCHFLALGSALTAATADADADPAVLARCQGVFLVADSAPASDPQAAAMLQLRAHARRSGGSSRPQSSSSAAASTPDPLHTASSAARDDCVTVTVQGLQPYGLVHVEFMQGLLLSESQPLLVVDDDSVAGELQGLQAAVMAGGERQVAAQSVLTDFGRLLDFRAAAERHAASSRAERQAQQEACRLSSSAPLPDLQLHRQAVAPAAASAPHSCSSVVQAASTHPAAARPPCRPPAKAFSSSCLRGSLPFALRFFATGSRAGSDSTTSSSASDAVVNRRRSFALETVLRQQQMRQSAGGDEEGIESVSCFPTGRRGGIRASLSFTRRRCAGLGGGDAATGAVPGSADGSTLPPAAVCHTGSSSAASSSSGLVVSPGLGAGHSVPERRRSLGDFVVSRSRSFRAFTRNFACGSFVEEEQQCQQQQHLQQQEEEEEEDVFRHEPGARAASEPALCCTLQQSQQGQCSGLSAGAGELQQDEGTAGMSWLDDVASEEGDSVSSFVAGDAEVQAAGVREHPLLTAEHKALMTDIGVRLLCYFLDRGWAASARMVMTTLLQHAAPVASFQAVSSAVAACHSEGLGLLHRAVRSGQLATIIEVLGWAVEQQACLPWDSKGARGLTPMHLLALAGCKSSSSSAMLAAGGLSGSGAAPQSIASLVLQTSPGLCSLWFNVRDDAGMTPAQYASSIGSDSVNQLASSCVMLREQSGALSPRRQCSSSSPRAASRVVQPLPRTAAGAPAARTQVAAAGSSSPARGSFEQPALLPAHVPAAAPAPAAVPPVLQKPCADAAETTAGSAVNSNSSTGSEVPGQQQHQQVLHEQVTAAAPARSEASCSHAVCWPPAEPAVAIAADFFNSNAASSSSRHSQEVSRGQELQKLGTAVGQSSKDGAGPARPPLAVVALAHLLAGCQHCLEGSPTLDRCLRVALQVLRVLWVLLLLEAVLHGSLRLMLVSVGAMTATTMLLRLLAVLLQPALRSSLTHAVELQWQLSLLWSSVWNPLPQAHSWLLAFDNANLEEQYKQVMAESRQQADAVIACAIKGLISLLPLLARCSTCEYLILQLLAAPARQWNLPTTHLLAAAVAAGLPLHAGLLNAGGYAGVRDSVLAATQGLLFVMLRKPLLLAAASGSAAAAVSAGVVSAAPSTPLFHGCLGALLLLLLRQRLCWAVWQAGSDAALGLLLLCWEWVSAAGPVPPLRSCLGSLLHVLLPLLALPMLYLGEKVDRQMALASVLQQKHAKQLTSAKLHTA